MPVATAAIGVGTGIISGILGSSAAGSAASAQENAENQAIQTNNVAKSQALGTEQGVYTNEQAAAQPYQAAGSAAVSQLNSSVLGSGSSGELPADQVLANDPGYQFRMDQGTQALQRAEAAGGGVGSGGAIKAGEQYAQGYASNEYANANARFMASNAQRFGQLSSIAGMGTTANGQMISAGSNYANESSNIDMGTASQNDQALTGIGNAQAAGDIGSANAWSSALSSADKSLAALNDPRMPSTAAQPSDSGYGNQFADQASNPNSAPISAAQWSAYDAGSTPDGTMTW